MTGTGTRESPQRERKDVLRRLRRIEGQVKGVIRMVEEGRECQDVVVQLAAIRQAVNRVGLKMLACYLIQCLQREAGAGGPDDAVAAAVEMLVKFS